MTQRPHFALALSLALVGAAVLTEDGDDGMVKQCRSALQDRLFAGAAAHGETFITAQQIKREAQGVSIHLELASGEGRQVAGTCIFRDSRLFDVK